MKKIIEKLIKIIIIVSICQIINVPVVKAAGYWDQTIDDANRFVNRGKTENQEDPVLDNSRMTDTNNKVYNILLALGIVLSVILGGILGVQIMWGSIEQQVKAKEMLMPYVAGCGVVFGAFGIWKLCLIIFSQL